MREIYFLFFQIEVLKTLLLLVLTSDKAHGGAHVFIYSGKRQRGHTKVNFVKYLFAELVDIFLIPFPTPQDMEQHKLSACVLHVRTGKSLVGLWMAKVHALT